MRPLGITIAGVGFGLAVAGCGAVLDVGPETLPNGVQGQTYLQELYTDQSASNRWELVDGRLPLGMFLSESTGRLSGIPVEVGDFEFAVRAVGGSVSGTGERTYTLTILERLTFDDATLATGRIDEAYQDAIAATGGVPPYTYSAENLPPGIDIDASTGVVSGVPNQIITGDIWLLTVTDSGSPQQTATAQATFRVKDSVVEITTTALPDATIGSSDYAATLDADHGMRPYTWSIVSGYLGTLNLVLDTDTGEIANQVGKVVPDAATDVTITVEVTDNDSPATTDTKTFTIKVNPAP